MLVHGLLLFTSELITKTADIFHTSAQNNADVSKNNIAIKNITFYACIHIADLESRKVTGLRPPSQC